MAIDQQRGQCRRRVDIPAKAGTRRSFLLAGMVAAPAAPALGVQSQRKPDFSGRWKADMEQSNFGSLPTPRSFVRVIDQQYLFLTITVESVNEQGKSSKGELRFSLDGEESVNEVGGVRSTGFARSLGSHVLIHTSREVDGMQFQIDEIWSLTDDGKVMTIEGAATTDLGEEELFVVMNRDRH